MRNKETGFPAKIPYIDKRAQQKVPPYVLKKKD